MLMMMTMTTTTMLISILATRETPMPVARRAA